MPDFGDANVIIRAAAPRDFNAVRIFGARLVTQHYAFDAARFLQPRENLAEGYASFLRDEVKRPEVVVLVAEQARRIVGCTYAAIEPLSWQELRNEAGVPLSVRRGSCPQPAAGVQARRGSDPLAAAAGLRTGVVADRSSSTPPSRTPARSTCSPGSAFGRR
jgi:hypothetical protein